MALPFIITGIDRVIRVDATEYPTKHSEFGQTLFSNELIYHLDGVSTNRFGDQVFSLRPDTVRFLPKGRCNTYTVDRESPGSCVDIFFQTDRPVFDRAFVLDGSGNRKLRERFQRIFALWVAHAEGCELACMGLLYQLLADILKHNNYCPEDKFRIIQPAVDEISANFVRKVPSCEALAEKCGISTSYLNRLFLEKFNVPPTKYIIQMRIRYACDLLSSGLYHISQVSEVLGYNDLSFFSKQFKSYVGISPTEYLQKGKSSK